MKLGFTAREERFRAEAAAWLHGQLSGPFRDLRGLMGQGGQPQRRREWERALGAAGWSCIGWPEAYGGRDASLAEQVIFAEEYARAGAPGRLGYMGVELLGPTILAFGNEAQRRRFLPPIARGEELAEAAAIAKSYCCDAFFDCAANAIQLHGGIGFTWEHEAHLYFKRARATATLLGSPAWQRERLVRQFAGGRSATPLF